MAQHEKVILIGISGPSCSGKTTLARLLRDIWPSTFILHEDDFYWADTQIPVKEGVQDWDCLESLDLMKMEESLQYIKANGRFPPNLESKEDQNDVGKSGVEQEVVAKWKDEVALALPADGGFRIALVDGFLLYSQKMQHIWEQFDVRLFLRTDHATVKQRREARSGYVTLEGFWHDPPDYVDQIVWPNYVQDHAFLFVDGDVEGEIDDKVCQSMNLDVMPIGGNTDMTKCLAWACGKVQNAVKKHLEA